MKAVIAYIRTAREDAVREALHAISGLSGASFCAVRGFGRGRRPAVAPADEEAIVGTIPRIRVEVMAADHLAPKIELAIARAAHTGQRGDGKVYVLPLHSARRISTGETGESAV